MNEQSTELVIPTGEIVPLADAAKVADAWATLRDLERQVRDAKTELLYVLVEHSRQLGTKTLDFANGHRAVIKGGTEIIYDAEAIINELAEAGMPEARIAEIVKETVTYKVDAVQAKRAAGANPLYAEIISKHSTVIEKRPSLEVK